MNPKACRSNPSAADTKMHRMYSPCATPTIWGTMAVTV